MAELKNDARPDFKNPLTSVSEYKTIYLCYPNWWGTYPRIVATFIERYDLNGKTIYPMCTHEGSGMRNSERDLRKALPGAIIHPGLPIKGTEAHKSDEEIKRWIFG